ncbi:MAG: cytidylate kinase-like family protein [Desulfobacterales bacterium]
MPIITISRGSFSHGKEIAERVAQELNYKCISREVLLAASEEFNIPEIALLRAIQDNLVYHGFAGHFLLEGIPNVLKVRICADIEERAGIVMEKEKVSRKQALKIIKDIDNERKKWAIDLYGKNPRDLSVYDLWLVISRLSIDDAINDILFTVRLPAFQTTPETQKIVKNLTIAARVKSNLMNYFPEADVFVEDRTVVVRIKRSLEQEEAVKDDIRAIVIKLTGVEDVRVDVIPIL